MGRRNHDFRQEHDEHEEKKYDQFHMTAAEVKQIKLRKSKSKFKYKRRVKPEHKRW